MSRDTPFVEFPAGATVLRAGEPAAAIFVIEAGKAAIERGGAQLAELGPGDVFGEAALADEPVASDVVARTALRTLKLDTATLPAVLRENVEVATQLMRRLAQRVRAAEQLTATAVPAPAAAVAPRPAAVAPPASGAPDETTQPAPPPERVDPRPRVEAAIAQAPAPTAQAVPNVPPVVSHLLKHATGSIAVPPGKAECLVGRPDPATGAIPEINLGPLDLARSLSRRHARLLVAGSTASVREEPGVANGTWVNGERLAAGQVVQLKPGDKLRFGAIELEYAIA